MRVNGLYSHIRRNDVKSLALFLIFIFLAELLSLGISASIIAEGAWGSRANVSLWRLLWLTASLSFSQGLWTVHLSGYFCWLLIAWGFYRPVLNRSLGARPLKRASAPRLFDQVETLAIATGLPTPKIVVIESSACNAFAIGLTPGAATIAVTRGLLQTLNEQELESVLAHEMIHIKNRDTRLMAVAALCTAIIFRVACVNLLYFVQPSPQWLFLPMFAAHFFWSMLVLLIWCCIVVGVCVVMVRLAISHAREYLADAGAIELTKNPKALISALNKMSGHDEVESVDFATRVAMISPMKEGLFSTHPSLQERVEALRRALPSMVEPPTIAASAAFSHAPPSGAPASPNAFRMRHGRLVVQAPDPQEKTGGFAEKLFEGVPDLSFLGQAAFWRALGREFAALKPPTWVSHPYILAPAVLLNSVVLLVLFPSIFAPFLALPVFSAANNPSTRPEVRRDDVPAISQSFHSPAVHLK
jgi:heat shock protein HtpX